VQNVQQVFHPALFVLRVEAEADAIFVVLTASLAIQDVTGEKVVNIVARVSGSNFRAAGNWRWLN